MDQFERSFADWVIRNRLWLILASIVIFLGATSSMATKEVSPTTNYRVFFSEDNPQLLAFEGLEKTYSKNDNVLFVLTPKSGNIYTRDTLKAIHWLSSEAKDTLGKAWKTPFSLRVDSITNFQYTEAKGDDLKTYALVANPDKLSDADLIRIRKIVESEPTLMGRVVSKKGHVAGVNVTIDLPGKNEKTETPEVVKYVRGIAQQLEAKFPNIKVRIVGMVMFNNAFSEAAINDIKTLWPIALGLMIFFLLLMLRSISSAILTIVVMIMSILTAMGMAIHFDTPFTPPTMSAPIVILTVAVANAVHILVIFVFQLRLGKDKISAIKESIRVNLLPVFLTSFTTTIGFLTMNFSDVPPFQHLGNIVAVGVVASFIFAITFLPAVMSYLPIKPSTRKKQTGVLMAKFANGVINRRRMLFWSNLIIILLLISFIPKNQLNDVFLEYFDKSIPVRNDMDYTTKNMTGLYQAEYSVESGKEDGAKNPDFLKEVDKFSIWLRTQKEVVHVYNFVDTIKRINKSLHAADPAYYKIPNSQSRVAENILLYESSVPQGFEVTNQLTIDKSATRITVNLLTLSTSSLINFENRVQTWLKANTKHITKAEGTGPTMMFAHISKRNIISMLVGSSIALIIISGILIIAFRSFKIGLVSMIPNLVPAAMGFGIWAIFSGQVGMSLSIVIGMTLGIVVDDTVHFLSKYLRARREQNLNAEDSVRYAFNSVGYALVTTSTVLVTGFIILSMSAFKLNADMGLLTAIVIVLALIVDFLFLPSLLMKLEGKKNEQTSASPSRTVTDTSA